MTADVSRSRDRAIERSRFPISPLRSAIARLKRAALMIVLLVIAIAGAAAPRFAPHAPYEQFSDFPYAPPMRPHVITDDGSWRAPFVYRLYLMNRLERRYLEDRSKMLPIHAHTDDPVFLLGTDGLGRDVFSRLLFGARASLGVAFAATIGALLIGIIVGAIAGYSGGWPDELLMRIADLVLVLPAIYVVLALRAVMPLVLPPAAVFVGLSIVLALVGWPMVARGVRAIVRTERRSDYAESARAAGATTMRVLIVHLLPATRAFIVLQGALLVPAFVLAEATLSFVGFGFSEPVASWGTMLQEAGNVRVFAEFPWLLAPAAAIALVALAIQACSGVEYQTQAPETNDVINNNKRNNIVETMF
jgi:peptide/nickel transport system permease protein